MCFAVASSGVVANKTGSVLEHYNRLSRATSALLTVWNRHCTPAVETLGAALETSPDATARLSEAVGREARVDGFGAIELRNRLHQFDEESRVIVPAAADAFGTRDYAALGPVVDRSQRLAEDVLANQVPETVALQRIARDRGAVAASAFGGGFGGSVWALVDRSRAADFLSEWSAEYLSRFPAVRSHAEFFSTAPGDGAGAAG
jgi:galactokinase